jgi:hypothetical protein
MANVENMVFAQGFKPRNLVILHEKGRSVIAAFDGTLGGRELFNIRELYEEYGAWKPGKGISVPLEHKQELLKALTQYVISAMGVNG